MGCKSVSAERLMLRFDQLKEEGHQLDHVALTHPCKECGFKIKMPKGRPPKDCNLNRK